MYKVRFNFPNNVGLIRGYTRAARAHDIIEQTNSTTEKHGVTVEYLGKEK